MEESERLTISGDVNLFGSGFVACLFCVALLHTVVCLARPPVV